MLVPLIKPIKREVCCILRTKAAVSDGDSTECQGKRDLAPDELTRTLVGGFHTYRRLLAMDARPEACRVGKEDVGMCRSRWTLCIVYKLSRSGDALCIYKST